MGALSNLFWGLLCLVSPNAFAVLDASKAFVIFIGLIYLCFAFGLLISSLDKARHWLTIFLSAVVSFSASVVFFYLTLNGYYSYSVGLALTLFHLIQFFAMLGVLNAAYSENTSEESAPKKFHDLVNVVRTSQNKTLLELSMERQVLLVFVRHFGCTFCRETVSEIAKIDDAIAGRNFNLVYVHMSDSEYGNQFFSQYYKHPVHHISDPAKILYRSLNLKRGTFLQLFGPSTWIRGIYAGLFKGHGIGETEGDSLQLGGIFILSQGQIVFEQKSQSASQLFQLKTLPEL